MRSINYLLALTVCLLTISGCDLFGISSSQQAPEAAGSYETTTFLLDREEGTFDVKEAGGFISVTLNGDRTVSGRMYLPEGVPGVTEGEGPVDRRFGGTFSASGDTIRFAHEEDTFVRGDVWLFQDGTLSSADFPGRVVLTRR